MTKIQYNLIYVNAWVKDCDDVKNSSTTKVWKTSDWPIDFIVIQIQWGKISVFFETSSMTLNWLPCSQSSLKFISGRKILGFSCFHLLFFKYKISSVASPSNALIWISPIWLFFKYLISFHIECVIFQSCDFVIFNPNVTDLSKVFGSIDLHCWAVTS